MPHTLLATILTLIILTTPTLAQPQDLVDQITTNTTIDLAGGLGLHFWKPGLDGNLVAFDTEGLKAWWIEGSVSVIGMPVASLHVVRPLKPSAEQNEMVQALGDKETGLSELLGTFDFLPLVLRRINRGNSLGNFIDSLLSIRISYYRDLYYSRTSTLKPFAYFPMGSGVDFGSEPPDPYGYSIFEADQELRFKTLFQDVHIMFPILTKNMNKDQILRLGVFRSEWKKAVENTYYLFEDLPIIQDSELLAKGISASFNLAAPEDGFGFSAGLDWGLLESSMKTAIDTQVELEEDEHIMYASGYGELRFLNTLKSGPKPIQLILGIRGENRTWRVEERVNVGETGLPEYKTVKRLDKDFLYQVFATLRASF